MKEPRKLKAWVHSPHIITAFPKMSPQEQRITIEMHDHYAREFGRHRSIAEPERVAVTVHGMIDESLQRLQRVSPVQARQVACRKGCAHCCEQHVSITKPEAVLLLRAARELGVPLDWKLVQRQAAAASGPGQWHSQPRPDWRCAFLRPDNACAIYEHRPAVCRKHAVIGDSAQCDTGKNPGGQVLNFVSIEAEILASAAMHTFETASMAAMLLRYRQEP